MENGKRRTDKIRQYAHDSLIFLGIFAAAVVICSLYRTGAGLEAYASPIFVLAVLLVSRFTEGYFFGLAASVLGVVCVNFFFTYPYMAVNFSIAGYPITFLALLIVSLVTSTLTSQAKQRDELAIENEREKVRNNLLRSVSHDIRTPLTSIIGFTSAILDDDQMSREKQRELLTDVQGEASWLLRMAENLLLISKMDLSQDIHLEYWAVEEVVGDTARKIRKNYPETEVEVSVPDSPLFVPMDPILISQVLFNLAENGILHGQTTRGISISVCQKEGKAVIEVDDDGVGFSERFLKEFQTDQLTAQSATDRAGRHNLGLGLKVSSAIIKAHKGELILKNRQDGGAQALVLLPLEEA